MKFTSVWEDLESYNSDLLIFNPSFAPMEQEEYNALMGRYAESDIRYKNVTQFKLAFMTLNKEAQEKLRSKLLINTRLRNLTEEQALEGTIVISNNATNPDTSPAVDAWEPLPYVNAQSGQKEKISTVRGLYNWKHSVGGQAFNEYLDTFTKLFKVLIIEEEDLYGQ